MKFPTQKVVRRKVAHLGITTVNSLNWALRFFI